MSSRRHHHTAALGLYGSIDAWHLVKVRRADETLSIERYASASRHNTDDPRGEVQNLLQQLPAEDRGLPLVLTPADGVGIYRRINVPATDDAVLDKIVAAQVETMLPGGAEKVRWGWSHAGADDAIWIHALSQAEVDQALSVLPEGVQPAALLADTMAVARLALTTHDSNLPLFCLAVGAQRSALILAGHNRLIRVCEFDGGSEAISHDAASDWQHQLRDLAEEVLSSLPPGQRPAECHCLCHPASATKVRNAAEHALGLPAREWAITGDLTSAQAQPPAVLLAASAAASCISPRTPTIAIAEQRDTASLDHKLRRYAIAAALWLLIALCGLYLSDRYHAAKVESLLTDGTLEQEQIDQLDMQIGIARYLEQSGPIPLAIMDEIGQKIPGYMFEEFSYERDGRIRLSGTRKDGNQIGELTNQLAAMQTLLGVQLQGQSRAGNKFRYDIVANAKPTFFGAFVPPPPQEPSEQDADSKKGGA